MTADPPPMPALVRWLPAAGAALGLGGLLWLWFVWEHQREEFVPALVSVGALFTAGKEGGIPLGIAIGGNPLVVGGFILVTDLAATAVLYPLVHGFLDGVQRRSNFLGSMLRRAQRRADRHKQRIAQYGPIALYTFMLVPFAFNSPLVGIIIGRIAGLRPQQIIPVLVCAITTTTAGWTLLIAYGVAEVLHVSPWVPVTVSLSITATVLVTGWLASRREKRLGGGGADEAQA
jgi:hypothetical protein